MRDTKRSIWAHTALALAIGCPSAEAIAETVAESMGAGLLGDYPMARDASGTSWQPDGSEHGGLHWMTDEWMLMGHLRLDGVYDWQDGPRGDDKGFLAGMAMGMATRSFGGGDVLGFRAMLSPDPVMGKRGYPLLLAAGETADGETPLVDRQHPHDLFMELSGTYRHSFSEASSLFVYAGLPGEPAFGPPAFMHRASAMDSPEAPITHHWLDSTHVTFGVVTVGWVHEAVKLEVSGFRGREPDEDRYDIESPALDSVSLRASWNPGEHWSLQASWADVESPEQLEPDEDEERWSVSGIYSAPLGNAGSWNATLAAARKERGGHDLDAGLAEVSAHANERWTVFARAEVLETDELGGGGPGSVEAVGKLSIGAIHDWPVHAKVRLGLGLVYSHDWVASELEHFYGGSPQGVMAFLRLVAE
jgi:hypothetical protein